MDKLLCDFFAANSWFLNKHSLSPIVNIWEIHVDQCRTCNPNIGQDPWPYKHEDPIVGLIEAPSAEILNASLKRIEELREVYILETANKMLDTLEHCSLKENVETVEKARSRYPVFSLLISYHEDNCRTCDPIDEAKRGYSHEREMRTLGQKEESKLIRFTERFIALVNSFPKMSFLEMPPKEDVELEDVSELVLHKYHPSQQTCLVSEALDRDDFTWLLNHPFLSQDLWCHAQECSVLGARCMALEDELVKELPFELRAIYGELMRSLWANRSMRDRDPNQKSSFF